MESISSHGTSRKDEWDRPTPLRNHEGDDSTEIRSGTTLTTNAATFTPSYTPKTVLSSRILKQMGLVPMDDSTIGDDASVAKESEVFGRLIELVFL